MHVLQDPYCDAHISTLLARLMSPQFVTKRNMDLSSCATQPSKTEHSAPGEQNTFRVADADVGGRGRSRDAFSAQVARAVRLTRRLETEVKYQAEAAV